MQRVDIMDAVQKGIENMIYKQWHHEGYIDGFNTDQVAFIVDGKRYVLKLFDSENK